MAEQLLMPRLSDSMEEAMVVKWLRTPGDRLSPGDGVAEIETDKATMTYESELEGVLLEILAAEGETVALGAPIAWVGEAGETLAIEAPAIPKATSPAAEAAPRVRATPVARRLAREQGVDLGRLAGTGPRGRVNKADVVAFLAAQPPRAEEQTEPPSEPVQSPPASPATGPRGEVELEELSRVQQKIARRMSESKATVPDFALYADVEMTACVELRRRLKEIADPAPTYNDMIVKAVALALREHPRANGSYQDGGFELHGRINVGVAVAAEDSLVVPTVFDADTRSLGEIARETRALAAAVREGSVTAPQLAGGTFSISNLGMHGIRAFTAIVNQPQAAILSVGSITRRPWVGEDDQIVARDVVTLGLSCDHRILYGAEAASFLGRIRSHLEQPLSMAL